MSTKYRVFHKTTVHTHDDGSKVEDIRPYDLRDRTKESAIQLAKSLELGHVRPKGGSRVVWSVLAA